MPEGKIIKALSGFYYVMHDGEVIQCRGRGVFRKQKISPLVGDTVFFQAENKTDGYIMDIMNRKNELVRPPIANIDQAILVFSAAEPDFNPVLLDRFLVLIESKGIKPLICISKMDLPNPTIRKYEGDYQRIGYEVIMTSSETEKGAEKLIPYLKGKTSVFAGQSGVGKSSLLNAMLPALNLKTDQISSHLGRGKHTTRHVELMALHGGLLADTPGFSSLEFTGIELEELTACFPEIQKLSESCKYRGCLHLKEPHCAVKQAVETGEIEAYRYQNYVQFSEEIRDRKPRY